MESASLGQRRLEGHFKITVQDKTCLQAKCSPYMMQMQVDIYAQVCMFHIFTQPRVYVCVCVSLSFQP